MPISDILRALVENIPFPHAASLLGQLEGLFGLREISQMEREMCSHLEWQLNIDPSTMCKFQAALATNCLARMYVCM